MGSKMAITMNPTNAPTTRIMAGAISETKVLVRARIWRSSMSATLSNISSSVPVSSPTAIIWITVFGKTPSLRKGAARESPPRVSSATREISFASTRLPMVFSTIFSAGNRETPLFTSVPRVRAKRLKAAARQTEPKTGRQGSTSSRFLHYPTAASLDAHEQPRMFLQGGAKSRALPDRIGNLQHDLPESGIFFLLPQAVQGLRNGDRRPQQRRHLTGEGRDFCSL